MLMEQIIEFELRVPKPLVVHVLLKLFFHDTRKIFLANHRLKYYLMLDIMQKPMYRAFPDPSQVTSKI